MNIGQTLRCYTVEPIEDPVPRVRPERQRSTAARAHDHAGDYALMLAEPTFMAMFPPSLFAPPRARRLGG